jgi:hypothetical protein
MKTLELSILLIILWFVVCMPELFSSMDPMGSSLQIAVLHW